MVVLPARIIRTLLVLLTRTAMSQKKLLAWHKTIEPECVSFYLFKTYGRTISGFRLTDKHRDMHQSDKKSAQAHPESVEKPLPLFRPEALASQQQKLYGEILLIRPLSLAFLGSLGVAIAACVLGFLLLGQITEKARVFGMLSLGDKMPQAHAEADLFVPGRFLKFLQPGTLLLLRGPAGERQSVTVNRISTSIVSPMEIPQQQSMVAHGPMYRVVVTLSRPIGSASSKDNSGTGNSLIADSANARVEVEVPLGRKRLIRWLFERSGA